MDYCDTMLIGREIQVPMCYLPIALGIRLSYRMAHYTYTLVPAIIITTASQSPEKMMIIDLAKTYRNAFSSIILMSFDPVLFLDATPVDLQYFCVLLPVSRILASSRLIPHTHSSCLSTFLANKAFQVLRQSNHFISCIHFLNRFDYFNEIFNIH